MRSGRNDRSQNSAPDMVRAAEPATPRLAHFQHEARLELLLADLAPTPLTSALFIFSLMGQPRADRGPARMRHTGHRATPDQLLGLVSHRAALLGDVVGLSPGGDELGEHGTLRNWEGGIS